MKKIKKKKIYIFLVLFCFQLIFLIVNFKIIINPKLFASKNKIKSSLCSKYVFSSYDPYTFIKNIDPEKLKTQNDFIEKFIKKNSLKLAKEYKGLKNKLVEIKALNLRILNSKISEKDIDLFFFYNFGNKIIRLKYNSVNLILNSFLIYFIFFFYLLFNQKKNLDSIKNDKINHLIPDFNSFKDMLKIEIKNINNRISDTNSYLNKLIEDKKNKKDIRNEEKTNSEKVIKKDTEEESEKEKLEKYKKMFS